MRKKGFTLIEVLGVITILALISTIIIIVSDSANKKTKETLSEVQMQNIKSAASMWRTDNIELIPEDDYYVITLKTLIDGGYIKDVKDIKTNENYDENLRIGIKMNEIILNYQ